MRARHASVLACAALAALAWAGCSSPSGSEKVDTTKAAASALGGYCRSTTCPAPKNFPQGGLCEPEGWPQTCGAQGVKDVPLFWRSGCLGWSLQKDGGHHISYDEAFDAVTAGFAAWTTRACRTDGTGGSHPSVDARYLGPAACDRIGYNKVAPNQNVIIFRDDGWPLHGQNPGDVSLDGTSPTIALTTVSFNPDTGEILDADIELNSSQHKIVRLTGDEVLDGNTFDLQSVLTHEIGHMLGLAHAPSKASVMFYEDEGHDIRKRTIGLDDMAAICDVYPPDGTRRVDVSVEATGRIAMSACDPTPRHGFTSACQSDPPAHCGAAPALGTGRGRGEGWLLVAGAVALAVKRRRRAPR